MADRDTTEAIRDRILSLAGAVPTSTFARLGGTALAAIRGGRLIRDMSRKLEKGTISAPDVEALASLVGGLGRLKGISMKLGQTISCLF